MNKPIIFIIIVCLALMSSLDALALRFARDTSSDNTNASPHSVIKINPTALKNAPVQGRALGMAVAFTVLLAALNVIPIATLTMAFYAVSYLLRGVSTFISPSWMGGPSHSANDDPMQYLSKLLPQATANTSISGPFSLDIETDSCRMSAICETSGALSSNLPSIFTSPIKQTQGILSSILGRASPELDAVVKGVVRNCKPYFYECSQSKDGSKSTGKKSQNHRYHTTEEPTEEPTEAPIEESGHWW